MQGPTSDNLNEEYRYVDGLLEVEEVLVFHCYLLCQAHSTRESFLST